MIEIKYNIYNLTLKNTTNFFYNILFQHFGKKKCLKVLLGQNFELTNCKITLEYFVYLRMYVTYISCT